MHSMAETLTGLIPVTFKKKFLVIKQQFHCAPTFSFVEDSDFGSGNGSGAGGDDEDDSGSGLGPYEFSPPMSPKINSADNPTTPLHGGVNSKNDNVNEINSNNIDVYTSTTNNDTHKNDDLNRNEYGADNNNPSSATTNASPWKIKRILLTYFLPIFMAWFGGICTDLL